MRSPRLALFGLRCTPFICLSIELEEYKHNAQNECHKPNVSERDMHSQVTIDSTDDESKWRQRQQEQQNDTC